MSATSFLMFGQTKLAEFTLASNLKKAEAFEVGDSLYVTYSDEINYNDRKQAAWISNEGAISRFELGPIAAVDLIEVVHQNDNYFFYFLELDKKQEITKLKAQQFNKITQVKRILEEEIILPGAIVAIFKENDLHIICLNTETGALTSHVISGMQVIADHVINLQIAVGPVDVDDIEFYNSSQLSSGNTGSTPFKIIKQGKILYLTADEKDKTTIIKMEIPSYNFQKFILGQSVPAEFNTFISDDIIYKLTVDKSFLTLDLYQLQSLEKLTSLQSFYNFLPENLSYERLGREHKIEKKKKFDPTITVVRKKPHWAIVVSNEEEFNSIRVGVYYNDKTLPIGAYLHGAIIAAIAYIEAQLSEGPGISRYFYYSESKNHSHLQEIKEASKMPQAQKADEYEIRMKKKRIYKGYSTLNERLIGIYGNEDKKIQVIKF